MGFDIHSLIETFGYAGLAAIVFAESGILLGFFLPGDSLLFTAGLLAYRGLLDMRILLPLLFVCAVAGDSFGYAFGKRVGTRLFQKKDARLFKQAYIERTQHFYEKHGPKTIVLARFVPVVRTFAPILAGVGEMPYRVFIRFNLIGGLLWAVGVTSAGYLLAASVPDSFDVDKYLLPIIGVVVFLSVAPAVFEILRDRRQTAAKAAAAAAAADDTSA